MKQNSRRMMCGMLCALAIGAIPTAVSAAGSHDRPNHRRGPGFGHMRDVPTTRVLEMMSRRLDLTDEQKQKIAPIIESTRQEVRDEGGDMKSSLGDARQKIEAILTDEQKEKMHKMKENGRAGAMGWLRDHKEDFKDTLDSARRDIVTRAALIGMDLTDEQKTKLREIQDNARKQRKAVLDEMKPRLEKISNDTRSQVEALLTPEQKEKLKARLDKMLANKDEEGRRPHRRRKEGKGDHRPSSPPDNPAPGGQNPATE